MRDERRDVITCAGLCGEKWNKDFTMKDTMHVLYLLQIVFFSSVEVQEVYDTRTQTILFGGGGILPCCLALQDK